MNLHYVRADQQITAYYARQQYCRDAVHHSKVGTLPGRFLFFNYLLQQLQLLRNIGVAENILRLGVKTVLEPGRIGTTGSSLSGLSPGHNQFTRRRIIPGDYSTFSDQSAQAGTAFLPLRRGQKFPHSNRPGCFLIFNYLATLVATEHWNSSGLA